MQIQGQLKEPSFAEKLAMIIMWTGVVVMWLFVLGCLMFGIVVTIWRELERAG